MFPAPLEIGGLQSQVAQRGEARRARRAELVEQRVERLVLRLAQLREAVELVERARLAVLEEDPRARDPVGRLAVDQVPDDDVRAPRGGPFGAAGPPPGPPADPPA